MEKISKLNNYTQIHSNCLRQQWKVPLKLAEIQLKINKIQNLLFGVGDL